ncbi:MAG TPA: ABC transporter permease [Vicinamibacterales bacterium]|nr:ABC transporter permease [Vicinamibacterales bacterium]
MFDKADFDDEIRAHLKIAAAERVADGASPKDAELDSLKEFGNVALTGEAARRVWVPNWLESVFDFVSDIRYSARVLAKSPVFSLTVIAVLTLGIGVNAAVFTLLKSMALNPLSGIGDSSQLSIIVNETDKGRKAGLSYRDYQFVRDHDQSFSGLAASGLLAANFGRGKNAKPIYAELVSGNYFQVLGVRAELGRTILPSDEVAPGGHPYAVLNDGFWRRDFGADPNIVGKTIEINNFKLTIVGVADPSFHGMIVGYDDEAFIPVMMAAQMGANVGSLQSGASTDVLADRGAGILDVFGFLRPGVTAPTASAQLKTLSATLMQEAGISETKQQLTLLRIWESPYGGQTFLLPALVVLAVMGLFVLTIACANIAGLVLVRGMSRRGELAVRLALGASRSRVVRLLLLENLVLAIPGAILGMLLAARAIPFLTSYAQTMAAPQRLFFNIQIDRLVIAFAAAVATASALVFGFVPALRSSRIDLVTAINEDSSPRGAARGRLRSGLVIAQVAVSLLLLVGAGLVTRSLDAARHAYPGFDPNHVTAIDIDLRANGYTPARGRVFYRQLLDAVKADPGVESATLASTMPLNLTGVREQRVEVDGYTPRKNEDLGFESATVGPDYFSTLRIPLKAGRGFEDRDDETAAPVAVVNTTFAQKFYAGADNAIGKRIRVGTGGWRTIVGVAADIKYSQINEPPRPYVYQPLFQAYRWSMTLHARGSGPTNAMVEQEQAHIATLDSDLPIIHARALRDTLPGATVILEFMSAFLFVFGASGMALAGMGIYGLVAYTVKQRTREIGIRMALGATTVAVIREFLGRGVRLGAIGVGVGVAGALAISRLLASVLFGVSATDAISFTRAVAIVLGGVVLATIAPAWRASRTNPLTALRHQ